MQQGQEGAERPATVQEGGTRRGSPAPLATSRSYRGNRHVEVIDLDSDDSDDDRKPSIRSHAEAVTEPRTQSSTSGNRQQQETGAYIRTNPAAPVSTQAVQCHCEVDARQHTVRKEGANNGRQFWSCAKPQDDVDRCTFFEWADNSQTNGGNATTSTSSTVNPERRRCECDLEAIRLVTSKAGARQGQAFWKCPNISKKAQCGFFVCEEGDESEAVHTTSGNVSGQICFSCGQSGHWASACPTPTRNNGSSSLLGNAHGAVNGRRRVTNAQSTRQAGDCYSCGGSGHWTKDCPDRQAGAGSREANTSRSKGKCFNCGNDGHWASACTEEGSSRREDGVASEAGRTRQRTKNGTRGGSTKRRRI